MVRSGEVVGNGEVEVAGVCGMYFSRQEAVVEAVDEVDAEVEEEDEDMATETKSWMLIGEEDERRMWIMRATEREGVVRRRRRYGAAGGRWVNLARARAVLRCAAVRLLGEIPLPRYIGRYIHPSIYT